MKRLNETIRDRKGYSFIFQHDFIIFHSTAIAKCKHSSPQNDRRENLKLPHTQQQNNNRKGDTNVSEEKPNNSLL
jgi:hypothetical protein